MVQRSGRMFGCVVLISAVIVGRAHRVWDSRTKDFPELVEHQDFAQERGQE
jgi:hypothetical protein